MEYQVAFQKIEANTPYEEIDPIQELEDSILCHKYLYYVVADPVISNYEYDKLERKARKILPKNSPALKIGSDRVFDYSDKIARMAIDLWLDKKAGCCRI
jgi:hypothetical protein